MASVLVPAAKMKRVTYHRNTCPGCLDWCVAGASSFHFSPPNADATSTIPAQGMRCLDGPGTLDGEKEAGVRRWTGSWLLPTESRW